MKCPDAALLSQLLGEQLMPEQSALLWNHLDSCSHCQSELDRLSDDHELKQWRPDRHSAGQDIEANAECQRMVERVAGLETSTDTPFDSDSDRDTNQATTASELNFAPSPFSGDLGMLGPYRIQEELGRGGMAIVFVAVDTQLDRRVAVKILRREQTHSLSRERFLREAKVIAGIRHPNVVTVHSVAMTEDGLPYIAMELAEAGCLESRIKREVTLQPRVAAKWIAEVANGLSAAHEAGLVHRDIKPSNILLTRVSDSSQATLSKQSADSLSAEWLVAKLADFGLARSVSVSTQLTQSGMLLGTPSYMSPESIANPDLIDELSDIYSLGVSLYESLTGEVPFRGALQTVLRRIGHDDPISPRTLNSAIPRDLETICMKAMHREPSRRYRTAKDYSEDLEHFLRGEPIHARPVRLPERFLGWCRRNPGISSLTGTVAALLILLAAGSTVAAVSIFRAEQKLKVEKVNVDQANTKIQLAADDAQQQRMIAVESLNSLVTRVQTELAARPGTIKLREGILKTALDGLARVTANTTSAVADHTIIEAHIRKGEVLDLLGQTGDAIAEFERAAELAASIHLSSTNSYQSFRDLANALTMQAEVHRRAFAYDIALPIYERVLEIREEVARALPGDMEAQRARITAIQKIADVHFNQDRVEDASRWYENLLSSALLSVQNFPDSNELKRGLCIAYERMGTLATNAGKLDAARNHFEHVLETNHALLETDPENYQYRADLAYFTKRLASLTSLLGEHEKAEQLANEAIRQYSQLSDSDRLDIEARMKLGAGWDTLYEVRSAAGKWEEAADAVVQGRDIFADLSRNYPTAAKYSVLAAEAEIKLVNALSRLGRQREVIDSLSRRTEFIDRSQSATDAIANQFDSTKKSNAISLAAMKWVVDGLDVLNDHPDIDRDTLDSARAFAMYEAGRCGNVELAFQIGEHLKDYENADPVLAANLPIWTARGYSLSYKHLKERELSHPSVELERQKSRALQACLATLTRSVEKYPAFRSFLRKELDFKAVIDHASFDKLFP